MSLILCGKWVALGVAVARRLNRQEQLWIPEKSL